MQLNELLEAARVAVAVLRTCAEDYPVGSSNEADARGAADRLEAAVKEAGNG